MKLVCLMKYILLLMSVSSVYAEITKEECSQEYDYSDRYPGVRDQDGHGLCWSFAAAALYEEALCLESRTNPKINYECGQRISVLDMARCDFAIGSGYNEGGFAESALKCVLSKKPKYLKIKRIDDKRANLSRESKEHAPGVCLETKAPFYNLRGGISGLYDELFKGVYDPNSLNHYLVNTYREFANCVHESNKNKLNDSIAVLKKILPKQEAYGVDFKKALTSGLEDEEFLRSILITPKCEEARLDISAKYKVNTENFQGYTIVSVSYSDGKKTSKTTRVPEVPTEKKFKSLKNALKNGTSVHASICYGKYRSEKKSSFLDGLFGDLAGPVTDDDCGGHAIVLAGLRWNEKKNRCETFVRNSWGSGSSLSGWVKADNLLDVTNSFSQMVKK
jgi:hypothetical protein